MARSKKPAPKIAKRKPAAKKSAAKKPAAKKSAAKKSAAKKPAAKKPAAKRPAAKNKPAPSKPSAASSTVERQAATMLADYKSGAIDNAWDVIGDLYEIDQQLPKTSPLRAAFDKMYGEIEDICRESAGG